MTGGAIREVKRSHGDVAEHAGSVGKRVAAQLWADMGLPEITKPAPTAQVSEKPAEERPKA